MTAFDKKEFKEKRGNLEQKRDDIIKVIESNNKADNNFTDTLVSALKLASGAGAAFRGSTTEEKRKLINLVFDNLELKGAKLEFKLLPPFYAFIKTVKTGEWCALIYGFRTSNLKFCSSESPNFRITCC